MTARVEYRRCAVHGFLVRPEATHTARRQRNYSMNVARGFLYGVFASHIARLAGCLVAWAIAEALR